MGWRYHKSINLGNGVRMNISKSGIGYSFGCNGFRVSYLPDGRIRQTVTIPNTGLSYITETASPKQSNQQVLTYKDLGGKISKTSSDNVSDEFEKTVKDCFLKNFLRKLKLFLCFFNSILLITIIVQRNAYLLIAPLVLLLLYFLRILITPVSPITIDYDFSTPNQSYIATKNFFNELKKCKALYHVYGKWSGFRWKTNAGCSEQLEMKKFKIKHPSKKLINSNVELFYVKLKNQTLYILPDKTIIVNKINSVTIVPNSTFDIHTSVQTLTWFSRVPSDASVVGQSWKYVNKDGSRDKRFNNNYKVPIIEFGALEFTCNNGFRLLVYGSSKKIVETARHRLISQTNNIDNTSQTLTQEKSLLIKKIVDALSLYKTNSKNDTISQTTALTPVENTSSFETHTLASFFDLYRTILNSTYENKKVWEYIYENELSGAPSFEGQLFKKSPCKLMVVGRSLNGWEYDFSDCNSLEKATKKLLSQSFDFSDVINQEGFASNNPSRKRNYFYSSSKFWKLIKYVLEEYGESEKNNWYNDTSNWHKRIVWSNLYKLSPRTGDLPEWGLIKNNIKEYIEIIKLEIDLYAPKNVLFVTGLNYIEPWKSQPSFKQALGLTDFHDENNFISCTGFYNKTKIIVCNRPDRIGTSDDEIHHMAALIKSTFENMN